MARYGPADVVVSWGGATVPDVTVLSDVPLEAVLEEITPFGSAWQTHAAVGVKHSGEITLEAPYSDDAGNLQAKAAGTGAGGTVAMILTYGGTKTSTFSAIVKSYSRVFARGALGVFRVIIQPTGTITEA